MTMCVCMQIKSEGAVIKIEDNLLDDERKNAQSFLMRV